VKKIGTVPGFLRNSGLSRFLLILGLALSIGCAKKSNKMEVWTISLRPTFTPYMQSVIARWEKLHPEVKVEWVDLPISAIQQKLIAALVSKSPPSVVNLNTDMALQLAENGTLSNLDEGVNRAIATRYFPGLWNAVVVDGGHYAIPWYVSTQVILYNAKIFKAAGLDPNHPPKTWDELVNDAIAIKERTGFDGWLPSIKFVEDLEQQGIPVVDPQGKKALFDSPAAVARLQLYVDLFRKGILPRDALSLSKSYQTAVDLYQSGKLGILQTGPQFLSRVHDNAPSVYAVTRVAPLPLGKGNVYGASVMNFVIPKNAPFKQEAVDFALYLTNDENQLNFSKLVLIFPSTRKAAQDSFFRLSNGDPLVAKARRIGAAEVEKSRDMTLALKNVKARNEALRIALENALMGRKSPYDALHEAALTWDKLLQ